MGLGREIFQIFAWLMFLGGVFMLISGFSDGNMDVVLVTAIWVAIWLTVLLLTRKKK